jgi:hypothetical protein
MHTLDHISKPKLLNTARAAAYLTVSESFLERDRMKPVPVVPFVRIGRNVRYKESTLDQVINKNLVTPIKDDEENNE